MEKSTNKLKIIYLEYIYIFFFCVNFILFFIIINYFINMLHYFKLYFKLVEFAYKQEYFMLVILLIMF